MRDDVLLAVITVVVERAERSGTNRHVRSAMPLGPAPEMIDFQAAKH